MPRRKTEEMEVDEEVEEVQENGDEGDEDEPEYEIETILRHQVDRFQEGKTAYYVKWKDYGDQHNSWVDEDDAAGARDLIDEYHAKKKKGPGRPRKSLTTPKAERTTSPTESVSVTTSSRKTKGRGKAEPTPEIDEEDEEPQSGAKSSKRKPASTVKSSTKKRKVEESGDLDITQHADMEEHMSKKTWDRLIISISTVERQPDGDLMAYFDINNKGKKEKCRAPTELLKEKAPMKLIEFYETNLRWRAVTDED